MTRQRPRGRGHRRAPSEPIDKMDIARIAGQLESDNHIKRQEQVLKRENQSKDERLFKMLSGTIMDGKNSARPRSAGPPTQRLSVSQLALSNIDSERVECTNKNVAKMSKTKERDKT